MTLSAIRFFPRPKFFNVWRANRLCSVQCSPLEEIRPLSARKQSFFDSFQLTSNNIEEEKVRPVGKVGSLLDHGFLSLLIFTNMDSWPGADPKSEDVCILLMPVGKCINQAVPLQHGPSHLVEVTNEGQGKGPGWEGTDFEVETDVEIDEESGDDEEEHHLGRRMGGGVRESGGNAKSELCVKFEQREDVFYSSLSKKQKTGAHASFRSAGPA